MQIVLSLSEVLDTCSDWDSFCADKGWSEYAVAEGGGDIEVSLTKEEAYKYGILLEPVVCTSY